MSIESRLTSTQILLRLLSWRKRLHLSLCTSQVPNSQSPVQRTRNKTFSIRRECNTVRRSFSQDTTFWTITLSSPVDRILVTLQSLNLLACRDIPYPDHRVQRSCSDKFPIGRHYAQSAFLVREQIRGINSQATEVIPASMGPCSLWIKSSICKLNTQVPFSTSQILADLSPEPETRNRPSREKSRE